MNKWIEELSLNLENQNCLQFYEETILELEDQSYENICNEIGLVKVIADFENKLNQNIEVFENTNKETKNLDVILNLKHLNIKIVQTSSEKIYFENPNLKFELIKGTNEYKLTCQKPTSWHLNHKKQQEILYVPNTSKIYIKAKHCSINFDEYNNLQTSCVIFAHHCEILVNNSNMHNFKMIGSSHTALKINKCDIKNLTINALFHMFFKCTNSNIEVLGDKEGYSQHASYHAMFTFENTQIEEVNLNQKFTHAAIKFKNCEIFDFEFKNQVLNSVISLKNSKVLNYGEFSDVICTHIRFINSSFERFEGCFKHCRIKSKNTVFKKLIKKCDEKTKWKEVK